MNNKTETNSTVLVKKGDAEKVRRQSLKKEIVRKLVHLLELPVLLTYTILASLYGDKLAILVLTALLIILLEMEYIRLEYRLRLPVVVDILRRKERDNIAGSIFFVASTIICFAAYNYEIALLALLLTVFGDLAAALFGIAFGKRKIYKKKTLEGFLAGLFTNLGVGYLLMPGFAVVFVPMAITASIVELLTGKLDDNLTVPLAAGIVGQIIIFIMQIPAIDIPGPAISWLSKII